MKNKLNQKPKRKISFLALHAKGKRLFQMICSGATKRITKKGRKGGNKQEEALLKKVDPSDAFERINFVTNIRSLKRAPGGGPVLNLFLQEIRTISCSL